MSVVGFPGGERLLIGGFYLLQLVGAPGEEGGKVLRVGQQVAFHRRAVIRNVGRHLGAAYSFPAEQITEPLHHAPGTGHAAGGVGYGEAVIVRAGEIAQETNAAEVVHQFLDADQIEPRANVTKEAPGLARARRRAARVAQGAELANVETGQQDGLVAPLRQAEAFSFGVKQRADLLPFGRTEFSHDLTLDPGDHLRLSIW